MYLTNLETNQVLPPTKTDLFSSDGLWHWLDDTPVDFTLFQPGQPDGEEFGEDCVEFPVSFNIQFNCMIIL